MKTRIVKLSFNPQQVEKFKNIFENSKEMIRGFDGCCHLKLLQDKNNTNIFFTYSRWENEDFLEKYRNSELFKITWKATKAMFNNKPEAWTVELLCQLD